MKMCKTNLEKSEEIDVKNTGRLVPFKKPCPDCVGV